MIKEKGRGLFRQQWYSIFSKAHGHDENCELCQCGNWVYVYAQKIEHFFYKYFYKLWFLWVNRPNNPKIRRLQQWFPNLR